MNKKKLPKAVTQDRRRNAQGRRGRSRAQKPKPVSRSAPRLVGRDRKRSVNRKPMQSSSVMPISPRWAGSSRLPLINVAGVTVIILRMVKLLCQLYGVPYEQGRARALVVGAGGRSRSHDGFRGDDVNADLFRARRESLGACGFLRHRVRLHPRYRTALRRAFRNGRDFDGLPCHRSAVNLRA